MEHPDTKSCIKELDLTLQPRTAPRYKCWLPLATQQLRLRSLIQIIGHKLRTDDKHESCWFYYTIHRTTMSSPLYTSELIDNSSPRWASLEVPTLYNTGYSNATEIIMRLWKRVAKEDSSSDVTMFTWGISFTGLMYIGSKLPNDLDSILNENSIVFHLHGGYFAPPFCFVNVPESKKLIGTNLSASEVRDSYTVGKLCSLRSKMQALKQQSDSVKNLRDRIASGECLSTPKYPQSSLNRLLNPRKFNKEKKAEILRIRKELEVAKFRTKLLEQERVRKMNDVRTLSQRHSDLMEENQDHGSELMDRYRELNKDIERLKEWRQNHIDSRETYVQTTACLAHRRRQLISELSYIYPISKEQDDRYLINNVHLPDSEKLDSCNDTPVAIALGFVAHTTQMIANFLNVPTRYPIMHYGSRSKIVDHITKNLPETDRQFPLFARSKDKLQFHYAVYLLNKNIAQLRWYCGLPTVDLRATLPNLAGLINVKSNYALDSSRRTLSGSSLEVDVINNKSNMPLTPPVHKSLYDKCHRTTRSMSHFKSSKTLLGSSLDQGLNHPVFPFLNDESKRICKSEETAIDNTASTRNNDNVISSNETIFVQTRDPSHRNCNDCTTENNAMMVESDIEIMTPMSISKPKSENNIENSTNTRQRSSNSISSCEMALSSSLMDGEDSSNGNSIKTEDNDVVFANRDMNVPAEQNSENQSYSEESSAVEQANAIDVQLDSSSKVVADFSHSSINKDCDSKDILSLEIELEETLDKESINSSWDTDSRQNQGQNLIPQVIESRPPQEVAKGLAADNPDCDSLLGTEITCSPSEIKIKSQEFTTSTEYMNSMRQSSESVCARTEALAKKTTSFKVMRPRL